ncbi:hypothetical protein EDD16DRAFT_1711039 [Pisolithus croceorrhizus]|nr:hypothetical protein EDD16DRAFT_1711039 [Pisolithus croceorrhizus]
MFPNGLFNNPWHSWHSPSQLEDVQTVCQNDLFDDEMSSTSDPADHTSSTTTLTQSQVDTSSFSAHAPAHTSNSVQHAASQHEVLELESHVNIWKKLQNQKVIFGSYVFPVAITAQNCNTQYHMHTPENGWKQTLPWNKVHWWMAGKEEFINKLQRQVQQQGKQNNTVTSLQSDLKQGEKAQTHRWYRFSTDQVQTPTDPTDPQTPQI